MKAIYTPPGAAPTAYEHDDQDIKLFGFSVENVFADDVEGGRYLGARANLSFEWKIRTDAATAALRQADLKAKMALAESAYDGRGADVVGGSIEVKHDDGTPSQHSLSGVGAGGVGLRVVRFGWAPNSGVEYATQRTAQAAFTFGAIYDPARDDGEAVNPATAISPFNWASSAFGGSFLNETGAEITGYNETYDVEGGDQVVGVAPLPRDPDDPNPATNAREPYTYEVTPRGVRREVHTIEIETRGVFFQGVPGTILTGEGIRRRVRFGRRRGRPPTYTTTGTYTKES